MVGQPLQHVADVADERAGRRVDRNPAAVAVLHLQPGLLGAQQQGDDVDVLVGGGADVRPVEVRRRIVQQAQDGIAVVDLVVEEAARQAQVGGDRLQQLAAEGVEGAV